MRTRLIVLAVSFGIVGLGAASAAGSAIPPATGGYTGASAPAGGHGGGAAHGGGAVAHAGGGPGGGGFAGGRSGSGSFTGGRFVAGAYRGGGNGSFADFGSRQARGGRAGYFPRAGGTFRIVGTQSAGWANDRITPRGAGSQRITLALGPRLGSAATATRVNAVDRFVRVNGFRRADRVDRVIRPHRGLHPNPPQARRPRAVTAVSPIEDYSRYLAQPPVFCDFVEVGMVQPVGCPQPVKPTVKAPPR